MLIILLAGAFFLAVSAWFMSLEWAGKRHTIFLAFCAVFAVEAVLAGPSEATRVGLFRVEVGGFDLRPQAGMLMAIFATRVLSTGGRFNVSRLQLLWGAFLVWYALGIFTGFTNGLPSGRVFFQGKAILYIAGGIMVGASADVRKLRESLPKMAKFTAALVILAMFVRSSSVVWALETPFQDFPRLGALANDTVTLVTCYGIAVILVELAAKRTDRVNVAAGLVCAAAPLSADQRASFLALGAMVLVLAGASFGTTWRRRMRGTPTQAALVLAAFLGVFLVGFVSTSSAWFVGERAGEAFTGEQEEATTDARFTLADLAVEEIRENPVLGLGVGATVSFQSRYSDEFKDASSHNVLLDIGLRTGVLGMGLFVASLLASLYVAGREWRHQVSDTSAALALGAGGTLLAVSMKALVEPAIDLHRMACIIGMMVGILVALARDRDRGDDEVEADEESDSSEAADAADAATSNGIHPALLR